MAVPVIAPALSRHAASVSPCGCPASFHTLNEGC